MLLVKIKLFLSDNKKYIISSLIIIIVLIYIMSFKQINDSSMYPSLENGDIILLDKISYRFNDIERNEVVSLRYNDAKYLIKRIIGLPGDVIEYRDNKLYVNDQAYREPFLKKDTITNDFSIKDLEYDVIPENMYLVLGDNRGDSIDSRSIGLIKKEDIEGKIFFRIWPLNKISFVK